MRVVRRLLLVPAGLAGFAVAVVPALGQSAGPTVHATTGNTFVEARVAVKPGTTVRWVNDGGFHNVHFEDGFNQPPSSSPPPAWGGGVRSHVRQGRRVHVRVRRPREHRDEGDDLRQRRGDAPRAAGDHDAGARHAAAVAARHRAALHARTAGSPCASGSASARS